MVEVLHLQYLAMIFFILFCGIGLFDGYYFHLKKYELYKHESSRTEHLIHTYRAFLFAPITFLLFVENVSGGLLWTVVFLIFFDLFLEVWDVLEEKTAREPLGGISSVETTVHIFATAAKSISFALILVSKPLKAWSMDETSIQTFSTYPEFITLSGLLLSVAFLIGGMSHLLLLKTYSRSSSASEHPPSSLYRSKISSVDSSSVKYT